MERSKLRGVNRELELLPQLACRLLGFSQCRDLVADLVLPFAAAQRRLDRRDHRAHRRRTLEQRDVAQRRDQRSHGVRRPAHQQDNGRLRP